MREFKRWFYFVDVISYLWRRQLSLETEGTMVSFWLEYYGHGNIQWKMKEEWIKDSSFN